MVGARKTFEGRYQFVGPVRTLLLTVPLAISTARKRREGKLFDETTSKQEMSKTCHKT